MTMEAAGQPAGASARMPDQPYKWIAREMESLDPETMRAYGL